MRGTEWGVGRTSEKMCGEGLRGEEVVVFSIWLTIVFILAEDETPHAPFYMQRRNDPTV